MSLSDRELLELAAKGAGIKIDYWHSSGNPMIRNSDGPFKWNPLTDDGDALRLAVAIQPRSGCTVLCLSIGKERTGCEFHFVNGLDVAANTRRAIVIAAAEIGKAMP